jgi:phosphatidylglycerophosphate synthase
VTTALLVGGANERLAEQLGSLGVGGVETVGVDVTAIAAAVRAAPAGAVVIAARDVFTQREALAGVLADPRLGTAILSAREDRGPRSYPLRSERGRAIAAASDFHTVGAPTEWFLGVLKVEERDRPALLDAAGRLAALGLGGDPVALLLVGLVRAGVHVGQSDLRALLWARPDGPAERAAAERDVAGHDEEKVLLDSSVKAIDGFFTTFLVSPYSKHIARWAARRGLTPNQVTAVSMLLGVLAAAAFATGERWGLVAGAVLLQVAFTTDCVDGQLARFTRTFTPLGAWLDSTFDRLKEWIVYAGLAIGAAHAGDPVWALAGAALTLQTARHAFDFSFAAAEHRSMDVAPQRPLDDPSDGGAPDAGSPAAAQALGVWRRLDATPGLIWIKRIVVLPIGERFALISLTAALWSPRTTFIALLVWGAFAAVYGLAGRVLRALLR